MAIASRLVALAEREFKRARAAPVKREMFRGLKINVKKFDVSWDYERGTAARMMSSLLRLNDSALLDRVNTDRETAQTYGATVAWFKREAAYLRKVANMLDTATNRLVTVLERRQRGRGASR